MLHLDVAERIIILPAAQGMELIASAQESLHHDGVCCGGGDVGRVLSQELEEA